MPVFHERCYMCDNIATSREHVPPRCLFPEFKDVKGLNFRNNLITVPSCDLHNSHKSKDDEFLMMSISLVFGNNRLAEIHSKTKVRRAFKRKDEHFYNDVILKEQKLTKINPPEGDGFSVVIGYPDLERLTSCFEHIAYGLYFHEFGDSFKGEIRVIIGFGVSVGHDYREFVKFLRKNFEIDNRKMEVKGDNPEVFKYQFCSPDEYRMIGLKMIFYSGSDVFVSFKPENTKQPFNLVFELINKGLPTTLNVNGEEFEFNKK